MLNMPVMGYYLSDKLLSSNDQRDESCLSPKAGPPAAPHPPTPIN